MDGKNQACGAVAGVSTVENPISLARKVMTNTPHVLLAGAGAEAFAKEMKVPLVKPSHFDTSATQKQWHKRQTQIKNLKQIGQLQTLKQLDSLDQVTGSYHGTVGCVAFDVHGNLAAATSTGGLSGKKFGRVGDSPIVGAGTFANNETCAVSCTGKGEQYIRHAVAYDVAARIKYAGQTVDQAVKTILTKTLNRGDGGIIAVDKAGKITMHTTPVGWPEPRPIPMAALKSCGPSPRQLSSKHSPLNPRRTRTRKRCQHKWQTSYTFWVCREGQQWIQAHASLPFLLSTFHLHTVCLDQRYVGSL